MRIIMVGYGQMGKMVAEACEADGVQIAGIVHPGLFDSPMDVPGRVDAVVDFSYPGNLANILTYAANTGCALLIGTTGYTGEQRRAIARAADSSAVMHASNYSLGVAVLKKVLTTVAPLLKERFDMEIIEAHHNKKADAPSGTALALLEALDPNGEYKHVFGRNGITGPREKEIGISAVRGGTATGTHRAMFMGEDEFLSFEHMATSRRIFATGAVHALKFIVSQPKGLYSFDDSVNLD